MTAREFLKRWKTHLVFGGGFLLVFIINVAVNLASGQPFLRAMGAALSEIRPMDYVLFVTFWYAVARGRDQEPRPRFTTLNLRDSKG
jgi:hypothetical protein